MSELSATVAQSLLNHEICSLACLLHISLNHRWNLAWVPATGNLCSYLAVNEMPVDCEILLVERGTN